MAAKGVKQTTPANIGFMVDTITQEKLIFQKNPERIDYARTPNWASTEIPGMSHNKLQFISGGNKTINFKLDFYFDHRGKRFIQKQLDWLESLTYPDYDGKNNFSRGAHPVLFSYGEMFKSIKCVVTNFKAGGFYLFDPSTLLPMRAEANIELTEMIYTDTWTPKGFREIRNSQFTDKKGKVNLL